MLHLLKWIWIDGQCSPCCDTCSNIEKITNWIIHHIRCIVLNNVDLLVLDIRKFDPHFHFLKSLFNHDPDITLTSTQHWISWLFFTLSSPAALGYAAQTKGDLRILKAISTDRMDIHYHTSCYNSYCFDTDYTTQR